MDEDQRVGILTGLFVACLVLANLIGGKISYLNVFGVHVDWSVGILVFPVTKLITDIVGEVRGRKASKQLVYTGLWALAFVLLIVWVTTHLPFAERSWVTPSQFDPVFKASVRMMIASLVAYFIATMNDVLLFQWLKQKTQGRLLWLRNNVSTIVSEGVDTLIFMFLAFYMVTPKHTALYVLGLAIPYYLLKVVVAVLHTPFCYWGVWWLKGNPSGKRS